MRTQVSGIAQNKYLYMINEQQIAFFTENIRFEVTTSELANKHSYY